PATSGCSSPVLAAMGTTERDVGDDGTRGVSGIVRRSVRSGGVAVVDPAGPVHRAVRSGPRRRAVGGHVELPPALVHQVMMRFAQWGEPVEIGAPTPTPRVDVVDPAVVDRDRAV